VVSWLQSKLQLQSIGTTCGLKQIPL
jgi:hypothetical protein